MASSSIEDHHPEPPALEKFDNTKASLLASIDDSYREFQEREEDVTNVRHLLRKDSGLPPMEIDAPISGELYCKVFYRRTNQSYGSRRPPTHTLYGEKAPNPSAKYGLSNRFTDHLAAAEMYRNRSLNTTVDRGRYMEGTHDWMTKL